MKKTVSYFAHDVNARNDDRILQLRAKHGPGGYAHFFMICEIMAETEDGIIQSNRLPGYAISLGVTHQDLHSFVVDLLDLGLLYKIDGVGLTSKRMQEHKQQRAKMSQGAKKARRPATMPSTMQPPSPGKTSQPGAAEIDLSPYEIVKKEAPIELETFAAQFTRDLNLMGSSFDAALQKWSTALVANNSELSKDPAARKKQLMASLRRYLITWISSEAKSKESSKPDRKELKA
jgi:hypothetical protein